MCIDAVCVVIELTALWSSPYGFGPALYGYNISTFSHRFTAWHPASNCRSILYRTNTSV